jgi:hypothetical protein
MDTIEGKNPFGIQPLKGPHSPSITPYAPAILVGEIGRWRRVAQTEGHHHLYTPLLSHPPRPRPPSGTHCALHWATPALRRAPVRPPLGTRPPSVGHPSGCPSALLTHWVSQATLVALSGFSVGPLYQAHHLTSNFFHPLHYLWPFSSIFQKVHPLSRKCIHFPEN